MIKLTKEQKQYVQSNLWADDCKRDKKTFADCAFRLARALAGEYPKALTEGHTNERHAVGEALFILNTCNCLEFAPFLYCAAAENPGNIVKLACYGSRADEFARLKEAFLAECQ